MSGAHRGHLALAFQEILTVTTRLREGRQVPRDAQAFRAHVKQLLSAADEEARRAGYPAEFVQHSVYAVIALLDESVLGTTGPVATDWAGRPLQEEVFGDQVAGERFFHHVNELLRRQDSPYVADVLEVHLLCLQLGFRGRYATSDGGELRSLRRAVGDKIGRIRGGFRRWAPHALPPSDESPGNQRDPWIRRLAMTLALSSIAVVVLVLLLRFAALAPQIPRIEAEAARVGEG